MKTLIFGAGLSGLLLADKLSSVRDVCVFDKARGVGGRMATRRTDEAKYDHGAQFYRLKEPLRELHERWLKKNLVSLWFIENSLQHFCARGGMTALAKDLAQDSNVVLNERVASLQQNDQKWNVLFDSGKRETADEVVFTCPAPQTLEILKASSIKFPSQLSELKYSSALVLLIEKSPVPFKFNSHGYIEPKDSLIFSVADQRDKGIAQIDALTVTLSTDFSDAHFDAPEDVVIQHAVTELKRLSPMFEPGVVQL